MKHEIYNLILKFTPINKKTDKFYCNCGFGFFKIQFWLHYLYGLNTSQ